jgi:hypothetical protein
MADPVPAAPAAAAAAPAVAAPAAPAAAPAAPAPAASFAAAAAAVPAAAAPAPGAPPVLAGYIPDKLPAELKGSTDRETIDKLLGAYSGQATELTARGTVPKEPKDYKFELSPDLVKVFGDPEKDRGTQIFRNVAHKHGLTAEQAAGVFSEFHGQMLADGVIKPFDIVAEGKQLLGSQAAGLTPVQIETAATQRWQTANSWIDGLEGSKVLSKEQAVLARGLIENAAGIQLMEALKGMTRETGAQGGNGVPTGGISKADLDARANDPRSNPMMPQYSKAYADETEALFKGFYK